jgi:hypothetical protein
MNSDSIYNYIKSIENENFNLKRDIANFERENISLKENEKEMLKVSTIITTTNENTKLKKTISILEKEIDILKQNIQSYSTYKMKEASKVQQLEECKEKEIIPSETAEIVDTVDSVDSENTITLPIPEEEDIVSERNDDVVSERNDDVVSERNDDVVSERNDDVVSERNDESDENNDNDEDEDFEIITIKKQDYYIDKEMKLYEIDWDNGKANVGKQVGYRKFIEKKNKFKTIFN